MKIIAGDAFLMDSIELGKKLAIPRNLVLELFNSGYQKGHHDTVEGAFSDDPHGKDSEYYHGDDVSEIIENWGKDG